MDTDIQPFKQFVKTIETRWRGIMNYVKAKINPAVTEGINNKMQLAKRLGKRYSNNGNFSNIIYFIAGKHKFNYPHHPSLKQKI